MSELKESTLSAAQRLGQERKAEYAHTTHAGDLRRLRKLGIFFITGPVRRLKKSCPSMYQDRRNFCRMWRIFSDTTPCASFIRTFPSVPC